MNANNGRHLLFIIRRTPVIMPAIVFTGIKIRAPKRAATEVGRPAARKERFIGEGVVFPGCWNGSG
jgi:hypothetical protein